MHASIAAIAREVELKLAGTTQEIERALRFPPLRTAILGRAVSRQLLSVYFDTPDGQLRRRRIGLRLRRRGRGWTQTVKRDLGAIGGLHQRDEMEHLVAQDRPDYAVYVATPFAEVFTDTELCARIAPVFSTDFRRTTRELRWGDSRIELSYDRGEIVAGNRHQALCELEFELLEGDPQALFSLAEQLCGSHALRLENRSKSARGHALAAGEADQPGRARPIMLVAGQSADHAFVLVTAEAMRHLLANEAGVMAATDPEYVHQARVAIRRLRAVIALFKPIVGCEELTALGAVLRNLAQALGVARDWDVFCIDTLPAMPLRLAIGEGGGAIQAQARARRTQADLFAGSIVAHAEFTLTLLRLGALLQRAPWTAAPASDGPAPAARPVEAFARDALARCWRRALKRAKQLDVSQPESFHPLRIALKKVRYGGEFFAALFPRKAVREFLSALADIQDDLGRLNDAATAVRQADELRGDCDDADARETLGALRGFHVGQMVAAVQAAEKHWRRLKRATPFWA